MELAYVREIIDPFNFESEKSYENFILYIMSYMLKKETRWGKL